MPSSYHPTRFPRLRFPRFEIPVSRPTNHLRFLLWIDAVGGYWVCGGDEVVLGQPSPDNDVDVPILGDLSRRHAIVRRDGEGYLLQPLRDVRVNGQLVTTPVWLSNHCVIELGPSVQLRFSRPHPLSATARLDFVSRHRTTPAADAILLLAESCILGPQASSHVVCRDWSQEVVLHRQEETLRCRGPQNLMIDGRPSGGRGELQFNSQVVGSDFSFSLEKV